MNLDSIIHHRSSHCIASLSIVLLMMKVSGEQIFYLFFIQNNFNDTSYEFKKAIG